MINNCLAKKEINSLSSELVFEQLDKQNRFYIAEQIEKEIVEKVKPGGMPTGLEEKQLQNLSTKNADFKKKRIKKQSIFKNSIKYKRKKKKKSQKYFETPKKSELEDKYSDDGATKDTPQKIKEITINLKKDNLIKEFLEDKKIEEKDNLIKNDKNEAKIKITKENNLNILSPIKFGNNENNNNGIPFTLNNLQLSEPAKKISKNNENYISISEIRENSDIDNANNINNISFSKPGENIDNNSVLISSFVRNLSENNKINFDEFNGGISQNTELNNNNNILIYDAEEPIFNMNEQLQNQDDTFLGSIPESNENNFYVEAEQIYDTFSDILNNNLLNHNDNNGDDIIQENQIVDINSNNARIM